MSEQLVNPVKKLKTRQNEEESDGHPVLPAEMFELIIGHMDVNERIACRAVCKYFKQAVDRIKIRSLAIAESEDSTCEPVLEIFEDDYDWNGAVVCTRFSDQFYFVSNDPVYESNALICPDTAAGLRTLTNHFDLSELRRLFVVEVRNGQAHFDLLNRLVQLEHLQIGWIDLDRNLTLQLPNLRTLSIGQVNRDAYFSISLETPNLKNFETQCLGGSRFQFEYPGSVKFVQVHSIAGDDLYELSNLEVLICELGCQLVQFDIEDEDYVRALDLSAFEKLKRVDCARMLYKESRELFCRCQNHEIDFYFCGLKVNYEQDLEYLLREEDQDLKLVGTECMFTFYNQLTDSVYYCEGIRYFKYLDGEFPDGLPKDFASKFYRMRDVYVEGEMEDVDCFVQFLKCFKNLKKIWLRDALLTQDFYDRHSHLFARVQEFEYKHDDWYDTPPPIEINLKFILNFKYLETFVTNHQIGLGLISDAFNTLKYLKKFLLQRRSSDLYLLITRTENEFQLPCFKKDCPEGRDHQFSSKTEMLKFVEGHYPALSTWAVTS